ncbi:internal virion protein [Erwinia phage vB_EamP-S2]|uniref:Internal virion protein n=1 Tax=Erwinia phage vB_EamP-S2 TaxID=2070198 RepID=A0A2K9V502_9CAUD|nr:internal virion protein [Erwinia phage vB_EamP-S2]AUV57237.1 internal virion protein [Erwinia phage vB_EamP-S2]
MSDMSDTDNRQGWNVVQQRDYAPTFDQIAVQRRELEEKQNAARMVEVAFDDTQTLAGGKRVFDRYMADFQPDPNFSVSSEQFGEIRREFGDEQAQDIVDGARSAGELNAKMGYYREDINRKKELASYGLSGVGTALVSSVLDPVGWALAAASGPAGVGAKMTQVGRVARMAAVAGVENAALEAALYAGDTQKSVDDIFVAGAFGGLMGGTIGALTRARVKPEPTLHDDITPDFDGKVNSTPEGDPDLAHVVDGADQFDDVSRRSVQDAADYDAWLAARANTVPEEFDVKMGIADHVDNLQKAANIRPTRAEKANIKQQIRDTEDQLNFQKQAQIDARAQEAAARGAPASKADALNMQVAKRVISRSYQEDIDNLGKQLNDLRAKQASYDGVGNAKAELKRFTSMDQNAQAAELGLHNRKVEEFDVQQHVAKALEDMRAERKARLIDDHPPMSHAGDNAEAEPTETTQPRESNPFGPEDDSIGAARVAGSDVEHEAFGLTGRMDNLMDDLITEARNSPVRPVKLGPWASVSSIIFNSKNLAMRGLGLRILENAQGGAYHGKTASILTDVNNNVIRSAEKNRYNDGFQDWLKENQLSVLEYLKPATLEKFNDSVYSAIARGMPDDLSPGVRKAAEGIADRFKKALEIRKAAGEAGFENVKSAQDYIPVLFDGPKIASSVTRYGADNVEAVLSNGYRTGKYKLGKKSADAIAKMQVSRALDSTLSSRLSFERVVSQSERQSFIDGLRESGIPDHIIDDFIEGQELDDVAAAISSRAQKSMGINTQAEVGGVKVQDLLKTNIAEIAENYGKEAAAGAAMARMGFRTRNEVLAAIDAAERTGRNMGIGAKQAGDEANMLRDSVRLLYGNTLDDDPNAAIVKATRRLREVTTITRLNQMGFAQAPEISRALVKMGIGPVMKSVGATKILFGRRGRVGGTAQGELMDVEMREVEQALGYIGEDNWLHGWATRHDEFNEDPDNIRKLSKILDNSLSAGSRANLVLSGFKAIQGGSEKIVTRSIAMRLKQHLAGERTLPTKDLEEIGLDANTMARLKRHFDDNPRYDEYNGEQVRMLNFDAMEPDLKEATAIAIRRMQGRLIQRHFVGDEGTWMNKWWGKALTQFKGFSIVSLEKQLIHDIRGDKAQAAMIFGWSVFLASAAYGAQMQMQSIGRADRKEFLDSKFNDQALAMGVFNKMPQVASLGLLGDGLASVGAMPDAMLQAPGRTGFRSMGAGDLVAGVGMVSDYQDVLQALSNYATGSDDVSTRQLVDKIRRVVPLANAIGIGQATKASVDLLEDQ